MQQECNTNTHAAMFGQSSLFSSTKVICPKLQPRNDTQCVKPPKLSLPPPAKMPIGQDNDDVFSFHNSKDANDSDSSSSSSSSSSPSSEASESSVMLSPNSPIEIGDSNRPQLRNTCCQHCRDVNTGTKRLGLVSLCEQCYDQELQALSNQYFDYTESQYYWASGL